MRRWSEAHSHVCNDWAIHNSLRGRDFEATAMLDFEQMLFSEQTRRDCRVDRDQFDRRTLNRYLLIPNRLIFASSVGLGSPNLVAAPVGPETRPALSARAASIISFSCRCSARLSPADGPADCGACHLSQVSSTEKVSPSLRMTARSITFCSSRMFPGQSYA